MRLLCVANIIAWTTAGIAFINGYEFSQFLYGAMFFLIAFDSLCDLSEDVISKGRR